MAETEEMALFRRQTEALEQIASILDSFLTYKIEYGI